MTGPSAAATESTSNFEEESKKGRGGWGAKTFEINLRNENCRNVFVVSNQKRSYTEIAEPKLKIKAK